MKDRVLGFLPLDNRPCTSRFPRRIAEMGGFSLDTPPFGMLGGLTQPAAIEEISRWLEENAADWQALVLSLDTLGFGGLIPSRQSNDPLSTILGRLEVLKKIKQRHPALEIYAFGVSTRLSRHAAPEEEKSYWPKQGENISLFSFHLERFGRLRQNEDRIAFLEAKKRIPPEILQDYLRTRSRNFRVLVEMIRWAQQGLFRALHLTQDDTEEFGINVAEKRRLAVLADGNPKILVYPGADEVASTLLAKFFNREKSPSFFPIYSHPGGEKVRGIYEDCSIAESVARHLKASAALLATTEEEADFLLFLNVPSTNQGDLCLEILDGADSPPRDLAPFLARLRKSEKPSLLVDVAYANGADPALMRELCRADLERLIAFSAWNTTGNSLGTALAAASAGPGKKKKSFLWERVAEDYLYMTLLRPPLRRDGDLSPEKLENALNFLWSELFGKDDELFTASYPWGRFFEADVALMNEKAE